MSIGLDIGSSSVKAFSLDQRGRATLLGRRRIGTRRGPGARVEHDAEEILRATGASLRGARDGGRLGLATQRSTVLFWDRDSGRALTAAYSWQDLRGARLCARLQRSTGRLVAERTGLRLSPHYAASKIAWALRRVPGLRRQIVSGRALWGTLGTYLAWRLSEGAVYAIDHANAQRTALVSLDPSGWDFDLFRLFGLDDLLVAPVLPALVPTFLASPPRLASAGRSFALAQVTGDQQAALLGLGCRAPGDLAINYGSGAFVLINVGDRPLRVPGLLTTLLASWAGGAHGTRARYAVEGPVNAAATALEWVLRRLRLRLHTRDLDAYLGPDPGGARAVHFLPAVSGLGAPRWIPGARPLFSGDLRNAGPRDLLRAAVESIACRCAEILRAARAGGAPDSRHAPVPVAGGLVRCRALLQAQSDLLQRPLRVRESADATAVGAALLARDGPDGTFGPRGGRGGRDEGDLYVRPRISADEAEARFGAWERAVYGPGAGGLSPRPAR